MSADQPERTPESYRDLPAGGSERFVTLLKRAAGRRCPQCGSKGIFKHFIELKPRCPRCDYRFDREEGYFLGGYALNVFFVGLIPLLLLVLAFIYTDYSWVTLEIIFIPLAILLPIVFFPYTRTFWMLIDLMVDPTEHTEKRLRSDRMNKKPK